MLDRILNINPHEKYKSGLKIITHPYGINRSDSDKNNTRDSALFSPLAKLLSKINWKILRIEYPSDDEILFNFLVDDLEFITIIDFNDLYENPYQEFSILQCFQDDKLNFTKEIKLKVRKDKISILKNAEPITIDYLSLIFERLKSGSKNNFRSIDSFYLNGIINGFEEKVFQEMDYILNVIYTFIFTRFKTRIKNNYILKTDENIPIIMQKVAIIYAE